MSPTRTFMNWVNVTITPQGGSPIAITRVTKVKVMRDAKLAEFYGDNDSYAAVTRSTERKRRIEITTGNIAVLFAIPDNTPCTINATCLDPINLATAGGGGFTITAINGVLENNNSEGQNNKFADGNVSFGCFGGTDQSGNMVDPISTVYL